MYLDQDLLWLNPLDQDAAARLGLDVPAHTAQVEGLMVAVSFDERAQRNEWQQRIKAATWGIGAAAMPGAKDVTKDV